MRPELVGLPETALAKLTLFVGEFSELAGCCTWTHEFCYLRQFFLNDDPITTFQCFVCGVHLGVRVTQLAHGRDGWLYFTKENAKKLETLRDGPITCWQYINSGMCSSYLREDEELLEMLAHTRGEILRMHPELWEDGYGWLPRKNVLVCFPCLLSVKAIFTSDITSFHPSTLVVENVQCMLQRIRRARTLVAQV